MYNKFILVIEQDDISGVLFENVQKFVSQLNFVVCR